MKHFIMTLWQDETGAETAEWLIVVALVLAVAIPLYTNVLNAPLTALVTRIGNAIGNVTP